MLTNRTYDFEKKNKHVCILIESKRKMVHLTLRGIGLVYYFD